MNKYVFFILQKKKVCFFTYPTTFKVQEIWIWNSDEIQHVLYERDGKIKPYHHKEHGREVQENQFWCNFHHNYPNLSWWNSWCNWMKASVSRVWGVRLPSFLDLVVESPHGHCWTQQTLESEDCFKQKLIESSPITKI